MTGSMYAYAPPDEVWDYGVDICEESGISTLLFGSAKIKPKTLNKRLNAWGEKGWRLVGMEIEQRRYFLLWRREAVLLIFAKPGYKSGA